MANLPRAVQAQLDQAEALLAGSAPADDQQGAAEAESPQTAEQTQPPEQDTAPAPSAPQAQPQEDPTWERRYKSLQGLFNAEMPKLQQANKDLSAQLQEAIARLDKLSVQQEVPKPQEPALDPRDIDNFGQDLVEMVQRQTQKTLGKVVTRIDELVASFESRLSSVEQALKGASQTVTATAEEMFFSKLTSLVPTWEQINQQEGFLNWLAATDPVYGQPRQVALNAAQRALDAGRVATIFNAYAATLPKTDKAAASLAKQVSPKAAASAPPTPTEKPTLSQAEVQAFYKDVALGKYRGRDAEAARYEAVINEALAEGRIR